MRRAMGDAGCALSCLCGAGTYPARRLRAGGLEEERLSDPSTVIAAEARPRLRRGVRLVHNEAQGGWVLLAPERVFKADPIAAEIIKRCTGEVTFGELVDDLAKSYAAPREKILTDVGTLLRGLADKKLLEVESRGVITALVQADPTSLAAQAGHAGVDGKWNSGLLGFRAMKCRRSQLATCSGTPGQNIGSTATWRYRVPQWCTSRSACSPS